MGISYSACIMVGLKRSDIPDFELFGRLLEEDVFDIGGDLWDEGPDDVIGFMKERSYDAKELSLNSFECESLRQKFFSLTGMLPKIYLTPCIS